MKTSHTRFQSIQPVAYRSALLALGLIASLAIGQNAHSQTITNGIFNGNLAIQPKTTAPTQPGTLDVSGNKFTLGSAILSSVSYPGISLSYTDDATVNGTANLLAMASARTATTFLWQQNTAALNLTAVMRDKMRLDSANIFSLYNPTTGVASIVMNPTTAQITVNGQTLLSPNASGNVGIGNTAPLGTLHVGGTTGSNRVILTGGTTGANYGIDWLFNGSSGSAVKYGSINMDYDTRSSKGLRIASNYGLGFYTGDSTGGITPAAKMQIDTLGNVGIGTTTPQQLLHVSGSGARVRLQNTTGDPVLEFTDPAGTSYLFTRSKNFYMRTDATNKHVYLQTGDGPSTQGYVGIGNGSGAGGTEATSQLTVRSNLNSPAFGVLDVKNYAGASNLFVAENGNTGIGTATPTEKLDINGNTLVRGTLKSTGADGVVFGGTSGLGSIPASGSGTRMMWYPKKAAFRAGFTTSNCWDDVNIGQASFATGDATQASGIGSFASGYSSTASGYASTAMGYFSRATNNYATALAKSYALGDTSFAAGNSYASGYISTAVGGSSALGVYSVALGGAKSLGDFSTAIGNTANARSYQSIVVGTANASYDTTIARPQNATAWIPDDELLVVGNGDLGYEPAIESNALVMRKNANLRVGGKFEAKGVIRCVAGGDISMGSFTAGQNPATLDAALYYTGE
jgi:hypothetical protein